MGNNEERTQKYRVRISWNVSTRIITSCNSTTYLGEVEGDS